MIFPVHLKIYAYYKTKQRFIMLKRGDVVTTQTNIGLKGVILEMKYFPVKAGSSNGTFSKMPHAVIRFDDGNISTIPVTHLINQFERRNI